MKELLVQVQDGSYPIYIENGLLSHAAALIGKVSASQKVAVITDSNVEPLYARTLVQSLEAAGIACSVYAFAAGEQSKNPQTLLDIYGFLSDASMNRGNLVIALGGGVVGDTAGFAAATYMRGIPYVQIPTSLLAQIDSSVGGKVAVDLPQGKNLMGNFYQPRLVIIDPSCLKTLSSHFYRDGMAEAIKYGCIWDRNLFDSICSGEQDLEDMIFRCVDIKRQVVQRDERDTGERMILNFGHTLGHAIEKHFHYQTYSHGEAVGLGMYYMAKVGEHLNLTQPQTADKIRKALSIYQLPLELDPQVLLEAAAYVSNDKKNIGGQLNVILLEQIGKSIIHTMTQEQFKQVLKEAIQ